MADLACLEKITVSVTEYHKRGAKTTSNKTKVIEPMPTAPAIEEQESRRKEMVPRRVRLTIEDFQKHGYTEKCPECPHILT